MTENMLLTREEVLRETFNNTEINTKDVKKFLLYFGTILQLGVSEGLIDEAGCNFIANAITNAIETRTSTDDDDEYDTNYVQIRNYMYIVSSYLQSKSKWNAWLELISIKSTKDAFNLINNAKDWMNKKITDSLHLLKVIKSSVVKVELNNVTNAYKTLVAFTKNTLTSTSDTTDFDVKDYHNSALNIGTYILMKDELNNAENFFEGLCNTIYSFCMEVSILSKINAKEVVRGKKSEAQGFFNDSISRVEEVNRLYKEKLSELKKEYDKKSKRCKDSIKLEREYSDAKFNLEKEWEERIVKLEELLEQEEFLQLEILGDEYSLYDLIKEYAIYQMAVKGDINYPSEMKERSKMLMMINTKQAISEFVLGNKYVLNSKEVAYLETIA